MPTCTYCKEGSDSWDLGFFFIFYFFWLVLIWLHYSGILCCSWLPFLCLTWDKILQLMRFLLPLDASGLEQCWNVAARGRCPCCSPAAASVTQASGCLFTEKCLVAGLGWRRRILVREHSFQSREDRRWICPTFSSFSAAQSWYDLTCP